MGKVGGAARASALISSRFSLLTKNPSMLRLQEVSGDPALQ